MGKKKFSIQELLVDAIQNADMGGLEDAVLVFSRRGDDKGTLINYLLGCTMKCEYNKKGKQEVLSVESCPDSTGRYPKIGHKVTAETPYPAKYTVQSQADRSISYVDFPRFRGNRGISTSALELIATQVAIKTIKSVRSVIFVVSWNEFKDPKLPGLKESLNSLSAIFKNPKDRLKSITMVISHLPKDGSVKKKDVLEILGRLYKDYNEKQARTGTVTEDDVNLMGFLKFFVSKENKLAENIVLFDPLADNARNKLMSNINKNTAFLSEEMNLVGGESVEREFLTYIGDTVRAGNTVFEKLLTLPEYKQTLEKTGSRIAQDLIETKADIEQLNEGWREVLLMLISSVIGDTDLEKIYQDKPLIIQCSGRYYIYGNTDGTTWKVTELDSTAIVEADLNFPLIDAPNQLLSYDEMRKKLYQYIRDNKLHTTAIDFKVQLKPIEDKINEVGIEIDNINKKITAENVKKDDLREKIRGITSMEYRNQPQVQEELKRFEIDLNEAESYHTRVKTTLETDKRTYENMLVDEAISLVLGYINDIKEELQVKSRFLNITTENYTEVKEKLKSLDKELTMYTDFFETNRIFYHALIKLNTIMNFKSDLYSQFCENFIKVLKMRNEENWDWEQTRRDHPFTGHRKPAVLLIGSPGKSTIVSKMLGSKYRIENTPADKSYADRQGGVEECVKMGDGMNSQTLCSQDIEAERDFYVVSKEDDKKENCVDCATISSHVVSEPKPLLLMYGRASVESRTLAKQDNNQSIVLSSDCKQNTYYDQNNSDNSHFFDAGDWDNVIHQHPETGDPVFTYRAYKDGREVGSASFYMHPLLCRSKDGERHNIIASTGIFSDLEVEARSLESVCAALPPTMFDKVVTSAVRGGEHGAVRGVANVIGYTLQARNVSAETAYYIQQAVCYGGYFLLRFNEYMAQVEQPDFRNTLDATLRATADTGTMFMTSVVADQFCRAAHRLGEYAQESGWTNTGKVLRFLGDKGRYGVYAYDVKQRGILEVGASFVTGGVTQSLVEGVGKKIAANIP